MTSTKFRLGVLAFLSAGILVARFLLIPFGAAQQLVVRWGYWIVLVGASIYAWQICRFLYTRLSMAVWRKYRAGVVISLFGASFLQLHEPHQFKVLFDEFTLSGVARNMHYTREASFPVKAHIIEDRFDLFRVGIDKRPLLFPFALCCVHDLTGYRPENVFVLNGVVTFLLLLLTYYFGAQYGGWRLGAICVSFWIGLPLLAQNATGGGYDLFNLFMLALFWYFGREYVRAPSFLTQSLFALTAVHLAQVRQESILYVALYGAVVVWQWVREKNIQLSWIAVLSPLCLVVPFAVNLVFMGTPSSFQTAPGQRYFSLGYLPDKLEHAIWFLFNFDISANNNFLLSVVGVIAIVAFAVKMGSLRREWTHRPEDVFLGSFFLSIIIATAMTLSQFWGEWDDAAATRFSLPTHLLFVFAVGRVVKEFFEEKLLPSWLPACAVVFAVVLSTSAANRSIATRNLWSGREYAWFLKELDQPRYREALVIANPIGPIVYNHAAVSFDDVEAAKWKIAECLKSGLYKEIVVLERFTVDYATLKELPYNTVRIWDVKRDVVVNDGSGAALSEAFKKETIAEFRLRPNVITRMSRVVSVEGPDAIPPKDYLEQGPPFKSMAAYFEHLFLALP